MLQPIEEEQSPCEVEKLAKCSESLGQALFHDKPQRREQSARSALACAAEASGQMAGLVAGRFGLSISGAL